MKTPPLRQAFTLMELLVVIAIIGILASLLFPAVMGAINAARKASAKNDVVQIANAVTMFETEYGRLPTAANADTSGPVNQTLMNVLMGTDTNLNPRKISFIEVGEAKRGKSGLSNGAFVDPWGGEYKIAMDADYNHTLDAAGEATYGTDTNDLRRRVAVWNDPSQHDDEDDDKKKKNRAVTSW